MGVDLGRSMDIAARGSKTGCNVPIMADISILHGLLSNVSKLNIRLAGKSILIWSRMSLE